MELFLIRHGKPEMVETNDGSPADPSLSALGKVQAQSMAEWLADTEFDIIVASSLKRAYETAEPLAAARKQTIQVESGVAEFDKDSDCYVPMETLKKTNYKRWQGMMKGEFGPDVDFNAFSETVINTIEGLVQNNQGKKVAVICHGGVINVWTAHVMGCQPKMFFAPDYTSISRYRAASSGERSIVNLNEAVHLQDKNFFFENKLGAAEATH